MRVCEGAENPKADDLRVAGAGRQSPKSDIDLAVQGGDVAGFTDDVNEKARTLLFFDVVDLERPLPETFRAEIVKDGVVLYEEVR